MKVDGNGEFASKFKNYREFEKFTLEVCKLGFQREIGTGVITMLISSLTKEFLVKQ